LRRSPGCPLDLADEALGIAVPNPSRPDTKLIVAAGHQRAPVKITADGAAMIDFAILFGSSASRAVLGADKKAQSDQPHAPRPTAVLLSRRPLVVFLCSRPPTLK
jgi:hypothetical protein